MNISYTFYASIKYIFLFGLVYKKMKLAQVYYCTSARYLETLASFLFLDPITQNKSFMDVLALDYPKKAQRFLVVYNLLSMQYYLRSFIYVWSSESAKISSLTSLYPSASWYEREVWDLFGIVFSGHKDLRRILTDYGFYGFPLRKDFPLSGFGEVYYDSLVESVLYRRPKLHQEFRLFETKTPWSFYLKSRNS